MISTSSNSMAVTLAQLKRLEQQIQMTLTRAMAAPQNGEVAVVRHEASVAKQDVRQAAETASDAYRGATIDLSA